MQLTNARETILHVDSLVLFALNSDIFLGNFLKPKQSNTDLDLPCDVINYLKVIFILFGKFKYRAIE